MLLRITLCTFVVGLFFSISSSGQEVLSLVECIQYAKDNSLRVKQSKYAIEDALILEKQARHARYPNLNATVSGNLQFGRTIDPTTNQFRQETIGSNSLSASTGVTLYNGNRIQSSIDQSVLDVKAAKSDADAALNDINLNIATAYLAILLAEEQLKISEDRLSLSNTQLEQTDKLIQAGTLPKNDRLDFIAQIATDEQAVIEAQNNVAINYLNLKQLMEVDPGFEFTIEKPEITIPTDQDPDIYNLEEVYTQALGIMPQIKAADFRLQSAALNVDLSRSGYFPSVRLFANINSFYSSRAQTGSLAGFEPESTDVLINDSPATITTESPIINFTDISYDQQIRDNFGQSVGLSISVPLYNNYLTKGNVERAQVGILNTKVTNDQLKQQLKTDVQRAIADAKAAKRSFAAAQKSLEAAQGAFENAQKRFDLGAINSLEYTTARNNLDIAQNSLIRSKYQYLFNLKVVDFYLGRPIRID